MTPLDKLYQIPKTLLIFLMMCLGLGLIMYSNPLADGCEVDIKKFSREVRGVLRGFQNAKERTQFALIESQKQICRDGNTPGSCENYFNSLKKITVATSKVRNECYPKLIADYSNLIPEARSGVKTLALIAWGMQPPKESSQRLGWLSQAEVYTFCRLKRVLQDQLSDEEYRDYRYSIYEEFPQEYPADIDPEKRLLMDRPKALRSVENPEGQLSEPEIFERSLFSIRCDMYY